MRGVKGSRASGVTKAMHEASRALLKGAVSAQKNIQEFNTEMRKLLGGREENSVSPNEGSFI